MAHDKELKKRRILAAALESISRNGYEGTRIRDVSEIGEVSIGVIQHYFGTREHLLGEALSYASGQLVEHFEHLRSTELSPWDELLGMIRIVCQMPDLHGRGLLWLEMSTLARRSPELRARLHNVYSVWDTAVRATAHRGIADGTFLIEREETIDDLVAIFLAFFDGYEYDIASSLVEPSPQLLFRRASLLAARLFRPVLPQRGATEPQ